MMTDPASAALLYRSSPAGLGEASAPPLGGAPDGPGFAEMMGEVARDTVGALAGAEQAAMQGMAGTGDPHAVVEALAAAELALETAVAVRDKAVQAYQEILRMPV